MLAVHVADIEVSELTGMGRIALHWKEELQRRGYDYIHIGPSQVPYLPKRGMARGLFPYAAYQYYRSLGQKADLFLVHEAAGGPFVADRVPSFIFSHGFDRRMWNQSLDGGGKVRWISKILYPIWRLRQCDLGVSKATYLLLSNYEDVDYARDYYGRDPGDTYVFKNGVYPSQLSANDAPEDKVTVIYLASWIPRKGYKQLIQAATILQQKGLEVNYLLAGTGADAATVKSDWPESLHPYIEVVPKFKKEEEESLLGRANIFVLPSWFEGQPLSLLQAMEAGRCCIASDNCGQRDVIDRDQNGLLYPTGNSEKLAEAIARCVADKDLRSRLGQNAKAFTQNRTWEEASSELVDRIESVLDR